MTKGLPCLALAAVAIVPPAAVAASGDEAARTAAARDVRVGDNFFVRGSGVPTLTVRRGDTVRWRWVGSRPHNVTVTGGPARFRSRTQSRGSFARRLTRRGMYTVVCTIHGARDQSMRIHVR